MKLRYIALLGALALSGETAKADDAEAFVRQAASKAGVPVEFALRVARVESNIRCGLIGRAGERGPLQIKPSTAKGLGFSNIRNASCQRQTEAGMAHLALCYNGSKGNLRRTAACHNQGVSVIYGGRISQAANRYASKVLNI